MNEKETHEAINKINGTIEWKSHEVNERDDKDEEILLYLLLVPDVSFLVCYKKESFGYSNLTFDQIWITSIN